MDTLSSSDKRSGSRSHSRPPENPSYIIDMIKQNKFLLHSSLIHPITQREAKLRSWRKILFIYSSSGGPQQELERGGEGGGGRRNGPSAAALRKPLQNSQHPPTKQQLSDSSTFALHSELRIAIHPITSISSVTHQSGTHIVCGASGRAGGRWWMPPLLWTIRWDSPSSCLVSAASSSALVSKHSVTHTGAYHEHLGLVARWGGWGNRRAMASPLDEVAGKQAASDVVFASAFARVVICGEV